MQQTFRENDILIDVVVVLRAYRVSFKTEIGVLSAYIPENIKLVLRAGEFVNRPES
jgi:hypothetical protein